MHLKRSGIYFMAVDETAACAAVCDEVDDWTLFVTTTGSGTFMLCQLRFSFILIPELPYSYTYGRFAECWYVVSLELTFGGCEGLQGL